MFISKNQKIIFYHIPKNAGNSIKEFLYERCNDGKFLTGLLFDIFCQKNPQVRTAEYRRGISLGNENLIIDSIDFIHLNQEQSKELLKEIYSDMCFDNYVEFVVVRNPYDRLKSFFNFQLVEPFKIYQNVMDLLLDIKNNKVDKKLDWFVRGQLDYINHPLTNNFKIFRYEDNSCEKFLQTFFHTDRKIGHFNVSPTKVEKLTEQEKNLYYELYEEEFKRLGYER